MRLLIFTGDLDAHGVILLQELRTIGHRLTLFTPPGVALPEGSAGLFDALAHEPDACDREHDLAFFLLDPNAPPARLARLVAAGTRLPLLVDAVRLPLGTRVTEARAIFGAVLGAAKAAVVREDGQLASFPTGSLRYALVLSDYLRFSFLPRTVLADVAWLIGKVLGQSVGNAPSSRLGELLDAPPGNRASLDAAAQILEIDPFFYPALLRIAVLSGDQAPVALRKRMTEAARRDPLAFMHDLALRQHIAGDNAGLDALKAHVFPARPAGSKGKRILLVVVYKQRDFFIDLLIRHHLIRLGHEVIMRPLGQTTCDSIVELMPDAIIWGAKTTPHQVHLARFAKDRGLVSIVRREEGGIYAPLWQEQTPKQKSFTLGAVDYSPFVDLELGFSTSFRRTVAREGHLPENRCLAIGGAPFDIYLLPQVKQILSDRDTVFRQFGLDPGKKLLLLATAWSYADRDPETALPEAGQTKGAAHAEAVEAVRRARESRAAWLKMIAKLCEDYAENWNVLIKVHPGEKVDAYRLWIAEHNIPAVATAGGYMVELLQHTNFLIHAGSTTAIEAHYNNIPSIAYLIKIMTPSPLYNVVPVCRSYKELKDIFDSIDHKTSVISYSSIAFISDVFYGTIDGNACLRAAIAVDTLLNGIDANPFRHTDDFCTTYKDIDSDLYSTQITQREVEYYTSRCDAAL